MSFCNNCGKEVSNQAITCPNCGHPLKTVSTNKSINRTTAGILAIFLGGIGAHKFYMNKPGVGILYLLFCFTFIPAILGFIEGLIYLFSSDTDFQAKLK